MPHPFADANDRTLPARDSANGSQLVTYLAYHLPVGNAICYDIHDNIFYFTYTFAKEQKLTFATQRKINTISK